MKRSSLARVWRRSSVRHSGGLGFAHRREIAEGAVVLQFQGADAAVGAPAAPGGSARRPDRPAGCAAHPATSRRRHGSDRPRRGGVFPLAVVGPGWFVADGACVNCLAAWIFCEGFSVFKLAQPCSGIGPKICIAELTGSRL